MIFFNKQSKQNYKHLEKETYTFRNYLDKGDDFCDSEGYLNICLLIWYVKWFHLAYTLFVFSSRSIRTVVCIIVASELQQPILNSRNPKLFDTISNQLLLANSNEEAICSILELNERKTSIMINIVMSDTLQRLIMEGLNTPIIVIILRSPIWLNSTTCSLIRSLNEQVNTNKCKTEKYPFHYIQQQSGCHVY